MIDPTVLTGLVGAFAGGGIVGVLIGRARKAQADPLRQRIDALKRTFEQTFELGEAP